MNIDDPTADEVKEAVREAHQQVQEALEYLEKLEAVVKTGELPPPRDPRQADRDREWMRFLNGHTQKSNS